MRHGHKQQVAAISGEERKAAEDRGWKDGHSAGVEQAEAKYQKTATETERKRKLETQQDAAKTRDAEEQVTAMNDRVEELEAENRSIAEEHREMEGKGKAKAKEKARSSSPSNATDPANDPTAIEMSSTNPPPRNEIFGSSALHDSTTAIHTEPPPGNQRSSQGMRAEAQRSSIPKPQPSASTLPNHLLPESIPQQRTYSSSATPTVRSGHINRPASTGDDVAYLPPAPNASAGQSTSAGSSIGDNNASINDTAAEPAVAGRKELHLHVH